jgi:DNA invertase Pin-like site-specific DNA recombinase
MNRLSRHSGRSRCHRDRLPGPQHGQPRVRLDQLKEALRFVRRGDTLAVTKHDRLARSTTDLLRIVEDFYRRGVGLVMLSMGGQKIDTRSPTGKLMVTMLAAIAEFERGLLLERQREGVAKANGKTPSVRGTRRTRRGLP